MEFIIEKLSSYNILNYLIPGAIFVYFLNFFNILSLPLDGVAQSLFVYYFCGMIISRIGSLVIEEIFKILNLIKFAPYDKYVSATKKDKKIEILLSECNMYRTFIGLFLTLFIIRTCSYLSEILSCLKNNMSYVAIICLFILFSVSYIKQTKYIGKRVNIANEKEKEKTKKK